jgi:tRNA(fMet)-specific endonuclease VapC
MSYLLDTNICIYIIKKRPHVVLERLRKISFDRVAISTITVAELEFGVRKSLLPDKNQAALNEFLIPFSVLDFGHAATIQYGIIRNELEKNGMPIGPLDTLIAAHAKSLNLTLVTNNEKEFSRVKGLQLENWAK